MEVSLMKVLEDRPDMAWKDLTLSVAVSCCLEKAKAKVLK